MWRGSWACIGGWLREAVRNAVPAQRKKTERPAVKMAAAATLIDAILESDRKAPRKQRHTARRIFDRIRAEVPGCTPAERTVRQYVEQRKRELGLAEHETFVPQSYRWGVEAQVDWYEAYADLDGERIKLQVFSMRSMASGAAFHRAYPCATQQAFLEAHELAFARLGPRKPKSIAMFAPLAPPYTAIATFGLTERKPPRWNSTCCSSPKATPPSPCASKS